MTERKVKTSKFTLHTIYQVYLMYLTMTFPNVFIFQWVFVSARALKHRSLQFSDLSKVTHLAGAREGAKFHESGTNQPQRFLGEIIGLDSSTGLLIFLCIPGGSEVKASACNEGDLSSIPGSGSSPGEGNGNPLQYSCLENPKDGGAWWATVHGVAKSPTRLSDFTSLHFMHPQIIRFHVALERLMLDSELTINNPCY